MEIIIFYHFDSDPRFPSFLLYVRWKSGVSFVRRCFRGVLTNFIKILSNMKAVVSAFERTTSSLCTIEILR